MAVYTSRAGTGVEYTNSCVVAVYTSRAGTGVKYTNHVLWLCTHLELGQELSTLTMCCGCVHI